MSIHVKLTDGSRIIVRGMMTSVGYIVEIVHNTPQPAYLSHAAPAWRLNGGYVRHIGREMLPSSYNKKERKQIMRTLAHMYELRLEGQQS